MASTFSVCLSAGNSSLTTSWVSYNDLELQFERLEQLANLEWFDCIADRSTLQGGDLDATAFEAYDGLVQACLDAGASCIVEVHNFARFK